MIVEFRAWLDAVRMLFLLMAHFGMFVRLVYTSPFMLTRVEIGIAIGFTTGVSNYTCPEDSEHRLCMRKSGRSPFVQLQTMKQYARWLTCSSCLVPG